MSTAWQPGQLDDNRDRPAFNVGDRVLRSGAEHTVTAKTFEWPEYCDDPMWMYALSGYEGRCSAELLRLVKRRDEAQTKVSKGGTNMRAAGEKPDPVEAEGCVAGNRSEGTFNEGEKRGEDPVGSGLSSDAGKAKAAFSLGRTSELGTDSAQSCPAPFESRTCTGAPRNCNGCGRLILLENLFCDDGCPCNSSRGINLKPQPCDICHDTLCVKPGHRITELFGVPDPRRESAPKWPTVDTFASVMRTKLDLNDHKGGWHGDAPHHLLARACEEMSELVTALNPRTKEANRNFDMAGQYLHNAAETLREFGECLTFSGRKSEVMDEAADVANMVMMVADVFGGTQRMANATTEEKK